MARGIAARRSAIASLLCSYKVTEPYRTRLSPKDGCKEAELGAGPSMCSVMPDGALLVSDDEAGAIYRISYKK